MEKEKRREHEGEKCPFERKKREGTSQLDYQSVKKRKMVRVKLISLSRLWYTIIVVLIHLILIYFGIKQCYFNDRLLWPKSNSSPKLELIIQKICLLMSLVLLFIFIYPALFKIGNFSNDNQQLTITDLKQSQIDTYSNLWQHCFSLSSTLHLIMSFLIIISTLLIHAKQIMGGLKDSGKFS